MSQDRMDAAAANDLAEAALNELLAKLWPGDVMTGFVLVMETMDADTGAKSIVSNANNGAAPWDTYGLLEWARLKEDSAMIKRHALGE
jgi:hypothetical protein